MDRCKQGRMRLFLLEGGEGQGGAWEEPEDFANLAQVS